MPLLCPQCGVRLSQLAAMPGHFRRAHPGLKLPPEVAKLSFGEVRRMLRAAPERRAIAEPRRPTLTLPAPKVVSEHGASEPEWYARDFPHHHPWWTLEEGQRAYFEERHQAMIDSGVEERFEPGARHNPKTAGRVKVRRNSLWLMFFFFFLLVGLPIILRYLFASREAGQGRGRMQNPWLSTYEPER
jgi:hypothetical protein